MKDETFYAMPVDNGFFFTASGTRLCRWSKRLGELGSAYYTDTEMAMIQKLVSTAHRLILNTKRMLPMLLADPSVVDRSDIDKLKQELDLYHTDEQKAIDLLAGVTAIIVDKKTSCPSIDVRIPCKIVNEVYRLICDLHHVELLLKKFYPEYFIG